MEGNFDWSKLQNLISDDVLLNILGRIGLAIIAVVGGVIVIRYIDKLIQHGMSRFIEHRINELSAGEQLRAHIRKRTLTTLTHHALVWAGYLIVTLMTLGIVGLDIRPVLATAGVASLAVGFGAQNLVKDLISGFFIILEDQYGQGDVVKLDGEAGVVEQLSLRTTHLRNTEGTLIVKTNGSISVVHNLTKDWAQVDFRIGVSYASDLGKILKILTEEGQRLRADFPQRVMTDPDVAGVDSFNESDITVRMFIKVHPGEQWKIKRELNRRIKDRFDREGIEIPFPQRTIWTKTIT